MSHKARGFTIVELLIVIVVIGILASITLVAYNGIQQRAIRSSMSSDLRNAATLFGLLQADADSYPTTMPSETKTSRDIILQATNTGSTTQFCINAYHASNSLRMSWDSARGGLQSSLCDGVTIGSAVGGTAPQVARSVNIAPEFSRWTLTSGATYNNGTGELTLTGSGNVLSPPVRVDTPASIRTGGDFFANTASVNLTPQGGYHTDIFYYGSDGSTSVTNSAGYTSNGCAQRLDLNAWSLVDTRCVWSGGPNVVYVRVGFYGPSSGYASPGLKIKNPMIVID